MLVSASEEFIYEGAYPVLPYEGKKKTFEYCGVHQKEANAIRETAVAEEKRVSRKFRLELDNLRGSIMAADGAVDPDLSKQQQETLA